MGTPNRPQNPQHAFNEIAERESERSLSKKPRGGGGGFILGIAVCLLVLTAAGGGYIFLTGKSPGDLQKISHAVSQPATVKVTGELFATTVSGDVKKGAGAEVSLIPVTKAFRQSIADLLADGNKLDADSQKDVDALAKKYPEGILGPKSDEYRTEAMKITEKQLPKLVALRVAMQAATYKKAKATFQTNSEGKFSVDVPAGSYILISDSHQVMGTAMKWAALCEAKGAEVNLICGDKTLIIGECDDKARVCDMQVLRQLAELLTK